MDKLSQPAEAMRLTEEKVNADSENPTSNTSSKSLTGHLRHLLKHGWSELALRVATIIACVALVLVVVWVMARFYIQATASISSSPLRFPFCQPPPCLF